MSRTNDVHNVLQTLKTSDITVALGFAWDAGHNSAMEYNGHTAEHWEGLYVKAFTDKRLQVGMLETDLKTAKSLYDDALKRIKEVEYDRECWRERALKIAGQPAKRRIFGYDVDYWYDETMKAREEATRLRVGRCCKCGCCRD